MADRLRFRLTLIVALAAGWYAGLSAATEAGAPAPSFEVAGVQGPIRLSAYQGKLVYLDFWASWCGPCRRSFPWMSQMQSKYGPKGLQIVAVDLDAKRADADNFLAENPAGFTVGFDSSGTVAALYGIKGMPSSILIGPDGKVTVVHTGFNEADKADLENMIKHNLPAGAGKRGDR